MGTSLKDRHGHSIGGKNTPTFTSWLAMKWRCNPKCKDPARPIYRKITICRRWKHFKNFLADMGERPDGMSLDRINNEKGYSPSNCRWATPAQQRRNQTRNAPISAFGESKLMEDWASDVRCKIGKTGLLLRLRRGWDTEKAISEPPKNGNQWGRLKC